MKPEICVVTGVAGFVGSQLAERLISDGHYVVGIDCFTDYYPRWMKESNLAHLRRQQRFELIEADLLDLDLEVLLREIIPGRCSATHGDGGERKNSPGTVAYIFHLAAQAGVRDSWGKSFDIYVQNNVLTTQRILEAAKGLSLKKLVYASSSSIYGDAESFPTPEAVVPRPHSPYGVTKLAAEHLCMLYSRNYGVPTVGLRYFTVYGPRQRPDMGFHRFIRAILEGREITVYGDGEQTRDFTYVGDAVDGTVRAAYSDARGEVFNIGGGSRVSVNWVIQTVEALTGKQAHLRYEKPSRGDVRHTSADIRRAASALGYAPRTTLTDGLRSEVIWLASTVFEPVAR